MARLASRTASVEGSCSYTPRCRHHLARILSNGVSATVTKPKLGGRKTAATGPYSYPHSVQKANNFMMLGYGRYLMAKTALLLMLMMMMMTGAMPGAAYSVTEGEAKTDDF